MRVRVVLMLLLTQVLGTSVCLSAQDKRTITEPKFPQTCAVYGAPLSSTPLDGPVIGQTAQEQNAESKAETAILRDKLNQCGQGQAVELTLGADSSRNAFLINPINVPLGVSLIIDAGVTVYSSRDTLNYQDPSTPAVQCGNYGPVTTYKVGKGCLPLITLTGGSGIYGYGALDGQGDKPLLGENSLGVILVLRSVWRGRIGEPKNARSKAPVPLIPQLEALLEQHREASGNPTCGPIFANGAGKALDLDSLYRRQMKDRLKSAGIEWEGWHGFRRGLATNLERIGVRESIAAMVLRHSNDRVTRKHYIKPPTLEAIAAMRRLSETLLAFDKPKMLPNCSPEAPKEAEGTADVHWVH